MANADTKIRLSFNPYETELTDVERAYRAALANGLEAVLDAGVPSIEEIVTGLNARRVTDALGREWTTASLEAELARLAW